MYNKTFCPILTIGFEPPKKGQKDNRTCMRDCAWYNTAEEKCCIRVITDHLEMLETLTDDMAGVVLDMSDYAQIENEYFGTD